ncbi:MAG: PQQ-binding-like beta-propeller repeat protein, partial [Verrucomicrobiota bacterium]
DRGTIYSLERGSGKLLWRRKKKGSGPDTSDERSRWAGAPGLGASGDENTIEAKLAASLLCEGERVLFLDQDRVFAISGETGETLWSSALPFETENQPRGRGASPDVLLATGDSRVFTFAPWSGELAAFDLEGGKLIWVTRYQPAVESDEHDRLISLNAGIEVEGGLLFAYGADSFILDASSGERIWQFSEVAGVSFPVRLRRDRSSAAGLANTGSGVELTGAKEDGSRPEERFLVEYGELDPDKSILTEAVRESALLLESALYWAKSRLQDSETAMGVLSDDSLWVMGAGRVKQLSLDLPAAAKELPAQGAYLGREDEHLWFREGATLHHLDYRNGRATTVDLSGYGANVEVAMQEQFLLVRDTATLAFYNAITGKIVGKTNLPDEFRSFVAQIEGLETLDRTWTWQGSIEETGSPGPHVCVPVLDQFQEGIYLSRLHADVIGAFRPSSSSRSQAPAERSEEAR